MNMISNVAAPAEFIERITHELEAITKSWQRIGAALSDAEEVFGYESDAFKQILKATKFSRGTATKLVKIARSERLRKHAKVFAKCKAWTTLYEVTTLSEEQFADLLDSVSEGEIVTFGMVSKVKASVSVADPYKVAFTVRIDENALKGGLVDGVEFERLMDLIAQIQDTVPFVRVDDADRFDKQSSRYMIALQREYDRLMRSHLTSALKKYKQNSSSWKSYKTTTGNPRPMIENFGSEEEVRIAFNERPLEVLNILGYDDFDQSETYIKAQEALEERSKSYILSANTPFRHANTIVNSVGSFTSNMTALAA